MAQSPDPPPSSFRYVTSEEATNMVYETALSFKGEFKIIDFNQRFLKHFKFPTYKIIDGISTSQLIDCQNVEGLFQLIGKSIRKVGKRSFVADWLPNYQPKYYEIGDVRPLDIDDELIFVCEQPTPNKSHIEANIRSEKVKKRLANGSVTSQPRCLTDNKEVVQAKLVPQVSVESASSNDVMVVYEDIGHSGKSNKPEAVDSVETAMSPLGPLTPVSSYSGASIVCLSHSTSVSNDVEYVGTTTKCEESAVKLMTHFEVFEKEADVPERVAVSGPIQSDVLESSTGTPMTLRSATKGKKRHLLESPAGPSSPIVIPTVKYVEPSPTPTPLINECEDGEIPSVDIESRKDEVTYVGPKRFNITPFDKLTPAVKVLFNIQKIFGKLGASNIIGSDKVEAEYWNTFKSDLMDDCRKAFNIHNYEELAKNHIFNQHSSFKIVLRSRRVYFQPTHAANSRENGRLRRISPRRISPYRGARTRSRSRCRSPHGRSRTPPRRRQSPRRSRSPYRRNRSRSRSMGRRSRSRSRNRRVPSRSRHNSRRHRSSSCSTSRSSRRRSRSSSSTSRSPSTSPHHRWSRKRSPLRVGTKRRRSSSSSSSSRSKSRRGSNSNTRTLPGRPNVATAGKPVKDTPENIATKKALINGLCKTLNAASRPVPVPAPVDMRKALVQVPPPPIPVPDPRVFINTFMAGAPPPLPAPIPPPAMQNLPIRFSLRRKGSS